MKNEWSLPPHARTLICLCGVYRDNFAFILSALLATTLQMICYKVVHVKCFILLITFLFKWKEFFLPDSKTNFVDVCSVYKLPDAYTRHEKIASFCAANFFF